MRATVLGKIAASIENVDRPSFVEPGSGLLKKKKLFGNIGWQRMLTEVRSCNRGSSTPITSLEPARRGMAHLKRKTWQSVVVASADDAVMKDTTPPPPDHGGPVQRRDEEPRNGKWAGSGGSPGQVLDERHNFEDGTAADYQ